MTRKERARPSTIDLARSFDGHLQFKGRSAGTREKYRAVLNGFAQHFGPETSADELSAQDIQLYLGAWNEAFRARHGREPSPATIKSQISALKAFYDYLDRFDFLVVDGTARKNPMLAVDIPTVPRKANDWLQKNEDAALLDAPTEPREEIIVWLLRWTGLRISEARNLRWSDVDFGDSPPRLLVQKSKTSSGVRTIPVVPELLPRLLRWREHLVHEGLYSPTGPVLTTRTARPMLATHIGRVLKRVAYRAGVRSIECTCGSSTITHHVPGCAQSANGEHRSEISAHTLRRTYGSYLLNEGVRLESVSKLLGHATTTITQQCYAELLDATVWNDLVETLGWAA